MAERDAPKLNSWRPAFLAALRNSANVRASCMAAKVSRQAAYQSRDRNARFAAEWKEAEADALDVLEAEARRRAMAISDTLMIFLLKAHAPEKYRETTRHEHANAPGDVFTVVAEVKPWDHVLSPFLPPEAPHGDDDADPA